MDYAITTVDNPYDPFDNFAQWLLFDELMGYHTCAWLARASHLSDLMSDEEREQAMTRAIDEIVLSDPANIYRKVTRDLEIET